MCLSVYIASDVPLPTIAWDENRPAFHVRDATEGYFCPQNPLRAHSGRPLFYAVGSHNGGGGTQVPATPGAPTLTALVDGQLHTEWGSVSGATTFIVQRMVLGQETEYMNTGTVNAASPSITITSLPPGESVRVRIIAVNGTVQSEPGPYAEIALPAPPPE